MYTKKQQQLLSFIETKVRELFQTYRAPAHGYDHAERVQKWSIRIAKAEKANVWLCEIIAVLHDIGRTIENDYQKKSHHELSYELCQKWFRTDDVLAKGFSKTEKLTILYSLRYHWNDAATKYHEAIILRDADKLDALGKIGVRRTMEYYKDDEKKMLHDMRFRQDMLVSLKTKEAKRIVTQYRIMDPINAFHYRLLKKAIRPVEL